MNPKTHETLNGLTVAEADSKIPQHLSLRAGVWRGVGDGGAVADGAGVPMPTPAGSPVRRAEIGVA